MSAAEEEPMETDSSASTQITNPIEQHEATVNSQEPAATESMADSSQEVKTIVPVEGGNQVGEPMEIPPNEEATQVNAETPLNQEAIQESTEIPPNHQAIESVAEIPSNQEAIQPEPTAEIPPNDGAIQAGNEEATEPEPTAEIPPNQEATEPTAEPALNERATETPNIEDQKPPEVNENKVQEDQEMTHIDDNATKIESTTQTTTSDGLPGENGVSPFATQIMDKDLSSLNNEKLPLIASDKNGPNLKIASFADDVGSDNCQSDPKQKPFACSHCYEDTRDSSKALVWEMIVFCNDNCLKQYQGKRKSCDICEGIIDIASIGKFSERTDNTDLKHFCTIKCLDLGRTKDKPFCLFCTGPIVDGGNGFLAAVGAEKNIYKNFCNQDCLDSYRLLVGKKKLDAWSIGPIKKTCSVCSEDKEVGAKLKLENGQVLEYCSTTCMSSYKYAQSLTTGHCSLCQRHFVSHQINAFSGIHQDAIQTFCSSQCLQFYRLEKSSRAQCGWCSFAKPELSMITFVKDCKDLRVCSVNCFYLYQYIHQNGNYEAVKPKKIEKRNKGTMKRPHVVNKGVTCRPLPVHKGVQTDEPPKPALVPIPVPVFLPLPLNMYQRPYPVPVPTPLPIPVPVFVPTTRNSTRGIQKFMKKLKSKMPTNVFEAQILEMAGALGDDHLDSDDSPYEDYDENDEAPETTGDNVQGPQGPKIPSEDVESIIKAGNIVPKPLPQVTPDACPSPSPYHQNRRSPVPRIIKDENAWHNVRRVQAPNRSRGSRQGQNRQRHHHRPVVETNPALAALSLPPKERPDAKHHLKFTYGVNAWRHWVVGKNAELEKARAQGKYMKPFETDILKLRADELNYTLCMFVKEVRKPNGDAYASDSILYLTLGIQEYLFENGRIDNIFTDMYYEPFTSAMHEVIKDFKLPVNELGYFVTRIEEEHLWESKQLGAHSPQVLLNTLIYFNAKYFMMKTLEDHTKLSFTHIMKHWKKGGTATPATKHPPIPGEKRTTLLRYYPPAHLKVSRHDDRKCFEQQELPDNPLRCPVKLYEFYLSHCPESAKNKNDLFYLQPERSCVPDSPVWYSCQSLNSFQLEKMLARILMVREVQEHMLADAATS